MFVTFGNAIKRSESNQHSRNDIKVHVFWVFLFKDDIIPRHVGEVFSVAPHSRKITVVIVESVEKLLTESPTKYKISHFYTIDCVLIKALACKIMSTILTSSITNMRCNSFIVSTQQ